MENKEFRFDRDFDSDSIIGFNLGRITLGRNGTARVYLLPDGVHIAVSKGVADKYIHQFEIGESLLGFK